MNKEMSEAQSHRGPYSPSRCRAEPWLPALAAVPGAGCPRGPRFGCCPPWSAGHKGTRSSHALSTPGFGGDVHLSWSCDPPSCELWACKPGSHPALGLVGSVGQGSRNGLFPFQHRQKRCGGAASPLYTTTAEPAPCSVPCFGAGDVKRSPGTPKLMKKVLVLPTRGPSSII